MAAFLGQSIAVTDVVLGEDSFEPPKSAIVSGTPRVFSNILNTSEDGSIIRGVWKCTAGVVTDVEENEMFTIIQGKGTVQIEGGPTLQLSPGTVGFFEKGVRTVWTIEEDILKTFQITLSK